VSVRPLLAAAVLLALVAGVWVLRETTMDREVPTVEGSRMELVLHPRTRDPEATEGQAVEQAVHLLGTCAGLVDVEVVPGSLESSGERLRAVVSPAPRGADQAELRGCLEDVRIKWLLVDVEEVRVVDREGTQVGISS
jgi:hypothetical protein